MAPAVLTAAPTSPVVTMLIATPALAMVTMAFRRDFATALVSRRDGRDAERRAERRCGEDKRSNPSTDCTCKVRNHDSILAAAAE